LLSRFKQHKTVNKPELSCKGITVKTHQLCLEMYIVVYRFVAERSWIREIYKGITFGLDSSGSGFGPTVDSCEHGNKSLKEISESHKLLVISWLLVKLCIRLSKRTVFLLVSDARNYRSRVILGTFHIIHTRNQF